MKEGDGLTTEGEQVSAAAAAEAVNAEVARANDDKERKSKLMDRKAFAAVDSFEARLHDKLLTGSDGHMKEGEPASAAAAEVNAEVARANDGKERESKQKGRKAFAAVDSFEARLSDKLLTGSLNPNTTINADMASDDDDASYPSGLKEEAPKKDGHVHEVVKGEGDLSDQSKGTAPASSGDVISNSAAVVRGDEKMISAYVTTINEDNIPIQPGVVFVPEPDSRGGIHTRSHSAHEHEYEESDADADSNDDIENQTQTLIEAYVVPDDDEQAVIIDKLHEQLARSQTQLELERTRSQLEGMPVVEGVPVSDVLDSNMKKKRLTVGVVLFLGTVAIAVGLAVFFIDQKKNDDGSEADAQVHPPVLEALQERKVLRCGTVYDRFGFSSINNETNEIEGFEIDLCKAVAAAALGSSYRYELIQTTEMNRFVQLANGEFDVLIAASTHTFERDVHEVSSGIGFTFSTPYMYDGMTFNGVPEFVTCADKLSVIGECASIRICSRIGTTWYDKTETLFPASNIVAEEKAELSALGYDGPYAQGVNAFTKEPLAIVTRDGDPEFAAFAELVLQSLFHAEAQNVTMMTADTFTQTGEFFGDEYEDMFKNALAAVGNYGEIYARHLEPISARLKVDTINHGETGLLISHPFGNVDTVGPGPIKGGVIESILERGFLRCGIPLRLRHSNSSSILEDAQEPSSDERVGLDMEFCRALSASILQRAPDNVSFKNFPASEYGNISLALENGDIDVYAGGEVNMNSNILSPGLSFSRPYFYEGGPSRGNSTAEKAFSLVTQEADAQFTDLVYWVVMAIIDAEENGITQMTSNEMPLVSLFGTGLKRLLRDAIIAVGNYDEMYRRVFGQNATRVGRNMLNASPYGPEHYPLPFGERVPDTDESR
ncbi:amino acid ABC transporter [Skeletonema marinoi]|uniref:Amino acid ABC transporter n=1 Tax=Skeletonema marinoi TaxID=267567 RepID=A0AAD8XYF2_9STRA|nr:amino acid ABC transporter [Skeletonema marinoi]